MANEAKLLAAAKLGNLDTIFKLAGFEPSEDDDSSDDDAALVALKWLLVAEDFGHDTEDSVDALMTGSSLHYDDDQAAEASVELELAEDYLRGQSGLAVDLELAREHLERAHELKVHLSTDVEKSFPALRKKLSAEALAVFDSVFGTKKTPGVKTPVAKTPAAKPPAAKKPVAKTPAAKPPAAKKPAAKKPATKRR